MYKNFKILALIPARGGSKGIPKKNLRRLNGKPLVVHSINQARKCSYVDRVVVSTDDRKIATVAKSAGAETPFRRPKNLATDDTPDFPVFNHALKWLKKKEKYRPDIILFLRPTGPLRTISQIKRGIELLCKTRGADSVRSINIPPQSPYKMWVSKGKFMKPLLKLQGIKEPFNAPRQKLPPVYQTNPNISVLWTKTLIRKKSMTGKKVCPLITTDPVVDIDSEVDFTLAEAILRWRKNIKK